MMDLGDLPADFLRLLNEMCDMRTSLSLACTSKKLYRSLIDQTRTVTFCKSLAERVVHRGLHRAYFPSIVAFFQRLEVSTRVTFIEGVTLSHYFQLRDYAAVSRYIDMVFDTCLNKPLHMEGDEDWHQREGWNWSYCTQALSFDMMAGFETAYFIAMSEGHHVKQAFNAYYIFNKFHLEAFKWKRQVDKHRFAAQESFYGLTVEGKQWWENFFVNNLYTLRISPLTPVYDPPIHKIRNYKSGVLEALRRLPHALRIVVCALATTNVCHYTRADIQT